MTDQKSLSGRAWAEMLVLALIWGGSFFSIRIALDEISPLMSVAHRVTLAMLVLWVVVATMRIPLPRNPRIWFAFLVMGLLNNVIPFVLMAWGQLYIESGLTSILNAFTAVVGVVMAALFFSDERLTPRKIIGVVLGFFGVAVAIGLENFKNFDLRSLAQLVWARKNLVGMPPQLAAVGMLTGATVIMLPLVYFVEGLPTFDLTPRTLVAIGYYAVIATAAAYLLYYRVLAMAGSGNLMLVTLLVAPIAITLGAVVLGEKLSANAYVGFVILAVGLIILDGRVWKALRR
jgi:drug/metabolite transporter (DMT)-like permease